MKAKIKNLLSFFETIKRGEENIIVLKDKAPEQLRESVRNAHGERLPSDWIYDKYQSILENLSNCENDDADNIDDNRAEIVDGLVDVYTGQLTAWLNSSNYNVYYITEVQEEYGCEIDGFKLLAMAQYKAIDDIFSEVADLLTKEK